MTGPVLSLVGATPVDRIRSGVTAAVMVLNEVTDVLGRRAGVEDLYVDEAGVPTLTFTSAVDAARVAHRLGLPRPTRSAIEAIERTAQWTWDAWWADHPVRITGTGRPTTLLDQPARPARRCNGCLTALGDPTPDELDALTYDDDQLPDTRPGCPVCVTAHGRTGRPAPDDLDALARADATGVVVITPENASRIRSILDGSARWRRLTGRTGGIQ